ncbi:vacuolar protein sorting-associated protein 9A-like [Benincasa hispida]|uniref:vacuolar protein sorting-associated protein 9A-like n=1 Tax=Benincasa hispida TaxID=102211 RepID=UPI001902ABDA|nr:vacuolar protein sorting-associated protein 9A-like [Benincasa hispida]XP_038874664.1 vacuolar protein sorting-associated protein 9A-like [Benincasa hispida]XP_038874665.1 vacuolar protein sorting-associated protein 9A-like [Benincasa hispida]XP_038874667.1 vacuolar protein sorting-associated protein 9A-like [Benincasa hispida]
MENTDVFLGLHDFLERMRQPSASDFVKSIKSFIVSFSNNAPDPERDSASVQEFFAKMEGAFRAHPLWSGCSEEELESAGEGLEKYVMTKLFSRVYASLADDVKIDEQLSEKMALIQQFIRPENLDIKPNFQNETSWLLAQKELLKINMHKAPRDKLVCLLSCCKVISNLLFNASIASNENLPGADEFLPVLIYVIIKANPPQLHSNLLYIQRYRGQSRLTGEAAYFFTNILSAESFILNIDAKALSMEEIEFEKNMESAQALLSGLSSDVEALSNKSNLNEGVVHSSELVETSSQASVEPAVRPKSTEAKPRTEAPLAKDQSAVMEAPSLSDLENKGAAILLNDQTGGRQAFRDYPYLFSQVGDLTFKDVEELLSQYKQLVFKYVSLSRGLSVTTAFSSYSNSEMHSQHHPESFKEPEDVRDVTSNDESAGERHRLIDGSDGTSLFGEENVRSGLPQDKVVLPQHEGNEETSQS